MDSYNGLNNATNKFTPDIVDDYKERVSYDANGNILTYKRNGDAARSNKTSSGMDDLTYSYKPNTNQLDKVVDIATDAALGEYDKYNDIKKGQLNGNYQYDEIGNLIKDSENIDNISWSIYSKDAAVNAGDAYYNGKFIIYINYVED